MIPPDCEECPACGGSGGGPFGRAGSAWDVETYECIRCGGRGYVKIGEVVAPSERAVAVARPGIAKTSPERAAAPSEPAKRRAGARK
jgi:hypothetical protein